MLVLSRKCGQAIVALLPDGRTLTVTVLAIRRGKVRLGIAADPAIPIHRLEVARKVAREVAL